MAEPTIVELVERVRAQIALDRSKLIPNDTVQRLIDEIDRLGDLLAEARADRTKEHDKLEHLIGFLTYAMKMVRS